MLNGYIFVCDHAVYLSVVADHRVLHQDGVLDHGALADLDALKDNAVLYRAVNDAAVGHQRVLGGCPGMESCLQVTIYYICEEWRVMYGFTGVIYFGGGIVDGRICGVRV